MKKLILTMMLVISAVAWDEAKITYVEDGDTLFIKVGDSKPFKARLIALDTFETKVNHRSFKQLEILKNIHPNAPRYQTKYQHTIGKVLFFGHKAKRYVYSKFYNKTVKFKKYGKDRYNRELVWIEVLNFELVRQGLAVYYPNNKLDVGRKDYLLRLSKEANLEKRGIYKRD